MNLQNKKILIIQLMHHGDALLATAAIDALKRHEPTCHIDFLLYKGIEDLFLSHPQIRKIYTIDRKWKKMGVRKQIQHELALLKQIKKERYDIILNYSGRWRSAFISALSGASIRLGYQWENRNNLLWKKLHTQFAQPGGHEEHVVLHNLRLPALLNIPVEQAKPLLCIDVTAQETLTKKFPTLLSPYILIHPGARWPFKCWDDDKMAEVINHLLSEGYHIVLTASPDTHELAIIQSLMANFPESQDKLTVLAGKLNLRELAVVIAQARLFIGVDSAPMHIAAALGTPIVSLFGPSRVARWRPYSEKATLIWAGDYGVLPDPDSINTDDPTRLLSAIPSSAVIDAIENQLALIDRK